jgi:hypothetical protein
MEVQPSDEQCIDSVARMNQKDAMAGDDIEDSRELKISGSCVLVKRALNRDHVSALCLLDK